MPKKQEVCGCLDAKCGGKDAKQTVHTAEEWTDEDLKLIASATGREGVRQWFEAKAKRDVCLFVSRAASTAVALPGQGGLRTLFKHIKAAATDSAHVSSKDAHKEPHHWTAEQLAAHAADDACPFTPVQHQALNWSLALCAQVLTPSNQLPSQTAAAYRVYCVQKIRFGVFHMQHFNPALFGEAGRLLRTKALLLSPHEATMPIAQVQSHVMCRMLHPTERQRRPPSQAWDASTCCTAAVFLNTHKTKEKGCVQALC